MPNGQKRPADAIENAVHIAKIATGEIKETTLKQPAKRKEIARRAAQARWG